MPNNNKTDSVPKIDIRNLIKVFKTSDNEVIALQNLNIQFHSGEITVVFGPSGCGKTTLMNCLSGITDYDAGEIILNGTQFLSKLNIKEKESFRREHIGYILQRKNLLSFLTVWENIMYPLRFQKIYSSEKEQQAIVYLTKFNLLERKTHFPHQLSGGELQRVAIIKALVKNADILLCDEPTGELDSKMKLQIMEDLVAISREHPNLAIIIVSHDVQMRCIADRAYYLRDGHVSSELTKDQLREMGIPTFEELKKGGETILERDNEEIILELTEMQQYLAQKLAGYKKSK